MNWIDELNLFNKAAKKIVESYGLIEVGGGCGDRDYAFPDDPGNSFVTLLGDDGGASIFDNGKCEMYGDLRGYVDEYQKVSPLNEIERFRDDMEKVVKKIRGS
jgi:hypothetical protein